MLKFLRGKYVSIIWTLLRIWLGYEWLKAGIEKVGDPKWVGSDAGASISGFFQNALAKATGEHPAVQSWYASFIENFALPNAKAFSYVVTFGEILVGVSLILGALTVVGLVAGAFMNLNYLFAGTVSTNPILYTAAIILLVMGYASSIYGVDRFILPYVKRNYNREQGSTWH
jgi:thiosulfate dehydrogenase (quinone) large subunit